MHDVYFRVLDKDKLAHLIPEHLNNPFEPFTPEICKIAAKEVQQYISENEQFWKHNFGKNYTTDTPEIKGKMFGVLIVKNKSHQLGYITTYSGKLDGEQANSIFIPSQFDLSVNDDFLSKGMLVLKGMGSKIKNLAKDTSDNQSEIKRLKLERSQYSNALQAELFEQYAFLNRFGKTKSLIEIFLDYNQKKPAAGSGECAAPKLLQHAYKNELTPIAIAEFWWGKSKKNSYRVHGEYYVACEDKCRPILSYMLS